MKLTKDKDQNEPVHIFYADLKNISTTLLVNNMLAHNVWLNPSDLIRFKALKKTRRQQQFLLARCIIQVALKRLYQTAISIDYQFTDYHFWQYQGNEQVFNVSISHSHDLVAVAISRVQSESELGLKQNIRIGLDVEYKKSRQFHELGEFFLNTEEQIWLQQQNTQTAFYRLWTAKEALFKASNLSFSQISQINCVPPPESNQTFIIIGEGQKYQCLQLTMQAYELSLVKSFNLAEGKTEVQLNPLVESDFMLM